MGWTDGLLRLWPAWEVYLGNYTIPAAFFPFMIGLPLLTGLRRSYPWIERKFTKDYAHHNLLQRPRDVPVRTALGVDGDHLLHGARAVRRQRLSRRSSTSR